MHILTASTAAVDTFEVDVSWHLKRRDHGLRTPNISLFMKLCQSNYILFSWKFKNEVQKVVFMV